MQLDKKDRTPKYIRIYDWVNTLIKSGQLRTGDKIPTEPEIALQFESSRMTVRKAIDPLVREGLLERRPGQGTYIISTSTTRLIYDPSQPIRFADEMKKSNTPHRFEIIDKEVVKADSKIQQYLNLDPGQKVICLTMLLFADEEPVIIERNYYPYRQFKELLNIEITIPPFVLIAEKFDTYIKKVRQYISAVTAGNLERKMFKVDYPIPCIYLEWISCHENGIPFSVSLCYYRGDVFKFKIPTSELVGLDTI
ncbi:MAG: GntR family transcriptional regulator [Deltaproteobacteria bacterium]|jgi:GntR family transcriptional regulator|nr:GntR family transcriptional regulator [Deltaproteobacteria bacterium]